MIQFEYMSVGQLLLAFAALALPIVVLGVRSLAGLGPVRRWVALGARLLVLLVLLLIIAGIRVERTNTAVELLVLRDVSESTRFASGLPSPTLRESVDEYLRRLVREDAEHAPGDRVGVISFDRSAYVDLIPSDRLEFGARQQRDGGSGTDIAQAIQLALATASRDAMNRILLITDGNETSGDLDKALDLAKSQGVPIDVMPIEYDVRGEVIVERMVSPPWRRENEPFTLDVVLNSTNATDVSGDLVLLHQDLPIDLDPETPGVQGRKRITLRPGRNVERVDVPPLPDPGVHQFKAIFEAPVVTQTINGRTETRTVGDTLSLNNVATSFTFVRGKGRVLYVDNVAGGRGRFLAEALAREGIQIDPNRTNVDAFPTSLVELQNYDAVVLQNVPRGRGGLSEEQQAMLAAYVHDMGGGLLMIGGEETFGAGGWQGSRLEQVLPVNMEVPAQRQIPKGALAIILHSCEMPNGNYWGQQCAIKAVEVLSPRDEVGILSFDWKGIGSGTVWDFPLADRGDGTKVIAAIKNAQLGDMPDFDDALNVALNGGPGQRGLKQSDARQKHVIIISDGDPQPPAASLIRDYKSAGVTVSTISVYPHGSFIPSTMKDIAEATGGRAYGPIESNPSQLPQIFVKEAAVVRRSLISEDSDGIAVKSNVSASELVAGIDTGSLPPVYGLVLTTAKNSPQVEMPLVAGDKNDPLLAHWQSGLGRAAVFTSDAFNKWAALWVGMDVFDKFWAQIVRGVSRPAETSDLDVRVEVTGEKGRIVVEALDSSAAFRSFLNVAGSVVGPDLTPTDVRLTQTAPGVYEAEFDAKDAGNYVVGLTYRGPDGRGGVVRSGTVVNTSPELRALRSNRIVLAEIARRTGGRVIDPFDLGESLFTRVGLSPSRSPLPAWDILVPILIGLILIDIAIRRIAWDYAAIKRAVIGARDRVRSFTTTRKVETTQSIDALRDIKQRGPRRAKDEPAESKQPVAQRKFDAGEGVGGDVTDLVGGATGKPKQAPPETTRPAPITNTEGGMGSLMEAKRRARQKMREQQERDQKE